MYHHRKQESLYKLTNQKTPQRSETTLSKKNDQDTQINNKDQ